jgi:hypothetical protein
MEVKSRHSLMSCGCTELLSSGSHRTGWVDIAGGQDRPLLLSNAVSHDSGSEKADVLSPPLINPGAGFEPSLWLSWWHK